MNSRLATTRINVIVPNSFVDTTNTIHIKSNPPIRYHLGATDILDMQNCFDEPRILVVRLTITKSGDQYVESTYLVTSLRHDIQIDAEDLIGVDLFTTIKLLGGFNVGS